MVFSSLSFLCIFFPAFLLLYYLLPKIRLYILFAFSLIFYAFGEPLYVALMLFSCLVNYLLARCMTNKKQATRKLLVIIAVAFNIANIGVFKYSGFLAESLNAVTGLSLPATRLALPLGISFYTFQIMSYVIDVYRGDVPAQKSFIVLTTYLACFAQLVAGPIVRYADVAEQMKELRVSVPKFSRGFTRFCTGLAKKVLLANSAGSCADLLLGSGASSAAGAWMGLIFFAFQIYFDFSGYSDMAIGMGKMMGLDFLENFDYPYIARSITDFWRRWHMSLSSFFRDYVYIPMGGNRRHQYLNILVVWGLTGLWHGASWNFVIWGLYFGVLLCIEKIAGKAVQKTPRALGHILTMLTVLLSWGIFYYTDLAQLGGLFKSLSGIGVPAADVVFTSGFYENILLLPVLVFCSLPVGARLARRWRESPAPARRKLIYWLEPARNAVLFFVCVVAIIGSSYNPFLYFRF